MKRSHWTLPIDSLFRRGHRTIWALLVVAACLVSPALSAVPILTTREPYDVTSDGATLKGEVTDVDSFVKEYGFVLGASANPTTADVKLAVGSQIDGYIPELVHAIEILEDVDTVADAVLAILGEEGGGGFSYKWDTGGTGTFHAAVVGLYPNTTVHVRSYAIRGDDTGYGEDRTFVTLRGPAVVRTREPDPVSATSAYLSGDVIRDGGRTVAERGIVWGLSPNPTVADTTVYLGDGTGPFGGVVTGLPPGATVHVRAYAINRYGTSYGGDLSFTSMGPPLVTTGGTTGISDTGANLNGTVNANGGTTDTFFEYSTDPGFAPAVTNLERTAGIDVADGFSSAESGVALGGIAVNGNGDLYVAYSASNRIRKITPAGAVTTLAGSGIAGFADGDGGAAQFSAPRGIAVDGAGNVYVADQYNHRIRKITPAGVVTTLAGSGIDGFADGPGGTAKFSRPSGVTVDGAGNVYVADQYNHRIRKITPAGVVTTLAGSGVHGFADGTRGAAQFSFPSGVALDKAGNVYVTDSDNHRIRKITPAGVVTTLAGSGVAGFADGSPGAAKFNTPSGIAVDRSGNVYVADSFNQLVRKVTAAGVVTTLTGRRPDLVAGFGDLGEHLICDPGGVTLDRFGRIYVTDLCGSDIWRIGAISSLSQSGLAGGSAQPVSTTLTGLSPGTTYYYRARAVNAVSTAAGSISSFTTHALPTVTTATPGNVTGTSATLGGDVTGSGGDSVNERGIVWGLTADPTTASTKVANGNGTGAFSGTVPDLPPGTTIHVRAYAINSVGTAYGSDLSFTTLGYPAVTTTTPSNITGTSARLGGNVTASGGTTVTERGIVWGLATDPTTADTKVSNGSGTGIFSGTVSGLPPGTTIHARAYAINTAGISYGSDVSFTTPATSPTVTTATPSDITSTSATLGGDVTSVGGAVGGVTERGIVWGLSSNPTTANTKVANGAGTGAFSGTVSGLPSGTVVHVRAYAINSVGTSYGSDLSLTTFTAPPTVTTSAPEGVRGTSATLGGNVTAGGGRFVLERGIVWGLSADPTTSDTKVVIGSDTGTFSGTVSGLPASSTVHVRAFARNAVGTSYGSDISFNTLAVPTVTTATPGSVTATSATLGGNVTGDGGSTVLERGVVWGLSADPTTSDTKIANGSGTGAFSGTVSGLPPGMTIHVRAYATTANGTGYGSDLSFTTLAARPTVTTDTPGNITATSATLGGVVTDSGGATPTATVTERGIVWGLSANPATSNAKVANGSGTGAFSGTVSGLPLGTLIHVRAYAINGVGTSYGADLSFNTLFLPPTVTTVAPSGVTATTARLNGTINPNGSSTDGNFRYSTDPMLVLGVATLAGSGVAGSLDGLAAVARFIVPWGIAMDGTGNVYVTDQGNGSIRKITPAGVVTTLADQFSTPSGIAVDGNGNLYVADLNNHRIRKITPAGVVTTLAGSGTAGFLDGTGTGAWFNKPSGVAVDGAGNLYVADSDNHVIRKVTPAGVVTRLAGSGSRGFADGSGGAARFASPNGVAVDGAGNIYVADTGNNCIRKVSANGNTTTLAGNGDQGFADGTAGTARFAFPNGVAVDGSGNVYVADYLNHSIRKITPAGSVTTLAGNGAPGFAEGVGGAARFDSPGGVAVDGAGNVYVADALNNRIRRITGPDILTQSAQSGLTGGSAVPIDTVITGLAASTTYYYRAEASNPGETAVGNILSFTTGAPEIPGVTTATPGSVTGTGATLGGSVTGSGGTTVTERGIVWGLSANPTTSDTKVANGSGTGNFSATVSGLPPTTTVHVRAYAINGVGTAYGSDVSFTTPVAPPAVTTATPGDITPTSATLGGTVTSSGGATVTERGIVWSLAANPTTSDTKRADGSGIGSFSATVSGLPPATTVHVRAYAINSGGTAYGIDLSFTTPVAPPTVVTSPATSITTTGATVNGTVNPNGGSTDSYFEFSTDPGLVPVTTLAGNGAGLMDGSGETAQFRYPVGVAVEGTGNIYVADSFNDCIRKISPAGLVTTLAGNGSEGFADGSGSAAQFNSPSGVAVDGSGNVYVADRFNHRIRKITREGVVTTLAGGGTAGFADGIGGAARFNSPSGVAVDGSGTVYVADTVNCSIRKITTGGVVTTLAGAGYPGTADGFGEFARFWEPTGVAVDGSGTLYVADKYNHRIRKVTPAGDVTTLAGNGSSGFANGPAGAAQFSYPISVAVGVAGNVYVADTDNHRIRKVTPTGVVTTLAGNGGPGFADGSGGAAQFNSPDGVAADAMGNIYVADLYNNRIRKITLLGVPAQSGLAGGSVRSINAAFTGLAPGATYYYRAVAANTAGTAYGSILSFTTLAAPAVTTATPSGVTTTSATLGGNVTASGGATVTERGIVWGLAVDPTTANTKVANGSGTGAFSGTVSGLPAGTAIHVRAYAINSVGTSYGSDISFNTLALPTATTAAPSGITATSATLGGTVTADGGATVTERGIVWSLVVNPTTADTKVANGSGTGNFGATVSGLPPVTTIHVRAYAINSVGTSYGGDVSFTTPPAAPVVTTATPSGVTATGATLGGNVTASGGATVTERGIVWGLTSDPTTEDDKVANGSGTGAFSGTVSGLPPGTSVHVRAYAINSGGTAYGGDVSFTTRTRPPTVTTATPENVTGTSATLGGNVADSGGAEVTERGIVWGLGMNPTAADTKVAIGNGTGNFGTTVTGLPGAATIHVRAYAINGDGTSYGSDLSFSTPAAAPSVLSATATAITGTGATLNGTVNPNGSRTDGVFEYSEDPALRPDTVKTLAGGAASGFADGSGSSARFTGPKGLAVDAVGNVFVADSGNHRIRKITPAGVVTTLAGSGAVGSANGTGSAAGFNQPAGVAVDGAGNVYVADTDNHRIRKITPAGVVTTLAGSTSGFADNVGGASSKFASPSGVAVDNVGNVYVADENNNRIRKIGFGGITTLAGSADHGFADGVGDTAQFASPSGLALDSARNVYVADRDNHGIRKLNSVLFLNPTRTAIIPAGTVTTLAGGAGLGFANGAGGAARFSSPSGVSVDVEGNVYVADKSNHRIRRITPAGDVTTLAGTGDSGFEEGPLGAAQFAEPSGVAVDSLGNLYVADSGNHRIRKIARPTIPARSGLTGSTVQPINVSLTGLKPATTYYYRAVGLNSLGMAPGNILSFATPVIAPVVVSPLATVITHQSATLGGEVASDGGAPVTERGVVFALTTANSDPVIDGTAVSRVLVAGTTGAFTVDVTGLDGGAGYSFKAYARNGLGTTYSSTTTFTTLAVPTVPTVAAPAVTAIWRTGATVGGDVTSDGGEPLIERGIVFALTADNADPEIDGAQVFLMPVDGTTGPFSADLLSLSTDTGYSFKAYAINGIGTAYSAVATFTTLPASPRPTVVTAAATAASVTGATLNGTINPNGSSTDSFFDYSTDPSMPPDIVTTIAGNGASGFADGPFAEAQFSGPSGVAVDPAGNIFVADRANHRIRKINPAGVVTTLAGSGAPGFADGPVAEAQFASPSGVAVDGSGNVYVADSENHRIRKIYPVGFVTTLAGSDEAGFVDGFGSDARFFNPTGVGVDGSGNVYVADLYNDSIRKVSSAGDVTTLAGGGAVHFSRPNGVAVDGSGNVYVADSDNSSIRKISPAGEVTTLAGGVGGGESDFLDPYGVAVDRSGNVYVADADSNGILKVSPEGDVRRLAGSGSGGFADGVGTAARFRGPAGIAVDGRGDIIVADQDNNRVRRLSLARIPGQSGLFGDNSQPIDATLTGVAPGTRYYFRAAASNATGTAFGDILSFVARSAATVVAPSVSAITLGGATLGGDITSDGSSPITERGVVYARTTDNPDPLLGGHDVVKVPGSGNTGVFTVDVAGLDPGTGYSFKAYAINIAGPSHTSVATFTTLPVPTVTTAAATAVSPTGATLNGMVDPMDTAADSYFEYSLDPALPPDTVTTLAGTGGVAAFADGFGTTAWFDTPNGIKVDSAGNVYVADLVNNRIRKVNPLGEVTTVAGEDGGFADGPIGAARFDHPFDMALDAAGNVYVADSGNRRIRKITPAGVVTTLAGSGDYGFADGVGGSAQFRFLTSIAVDAAGNLYVADQPNQRIRKVTPAGVVTTLAGSGEPGFADGAGEAARFSDPFGVAVDGAGNVYVADQGNNSIRKVSPAGEVTTLAGSGDYGFAEGIGGAAQFSYPGSVAVDGTGNVYVADTGNQRIRMVSPEGEVTTLAGSGAFGYGDGPFGAAQFAGPAGIAVDALGQVYVADGAGNTIRKLAALAVPAQSGLTGSGVLPVDATVSGLAPFTTYHYRAVARNANGTTRGAIQTFTTPASSPYVEGPVATRVGSYSATLGGVVTHENGEGVIERGVVFAAASIDGDPLIGGADVTQVAVTGTTEEFTADVTGLQADTTYSFKAYAINSLGTTYTTVGSFTTPLPAPTDILLSATAIDENNLPGALIGTLTAADPDIGDTHTFALVEGEGDWDNAAFTIDGAELTINGSTDAENQPEYSIRVRATDDGGLSYEKQIIITVNDGNDPPIGSPDGISRPDNKSSVKVAVSALLANDSDPEFDTLTIISVGNAQPSGATVNLVGGFVIYLAPSAGAGDGGFEYTLSDGNGNSPITTVTVTQVATPAPEQAPNQAYIVATGSDIDLSYIGVPGRRYRVQFTTSTEAPYVWQEYAPPAVYTAPASGVFVHTDHNPEEAVRLYRAVPHR